MQQVDQDLQLRLGRAAELECFRVMHAGGKKVLWHRPEDYEHATGNEVAEEVKQSWYQKTGKERMKWPVGGVHDDDDEAGEGLGQAPRIGSWADDE